MLRLGGGEEGKLPAINIYCEIPIRVDTITLQTQQQNLFNILEIKICMHSHTLCLFFSLSFFYFQEHIYHRKCANWCGGG